MDLHEFYIDKFDQTLIEAFEAVAIQAKAEQREADAKEIEELKVEIRVLEDEIKWLEER